MAIARYLAAMADDMDLLLPESGEIIWMTDGIALPGNGSFLPGAVPEGSLLMVSDRQPAAEVSWQDSLEALIRAVHRIRCKTVLLDFQRPGIPAQRKLAEAAISRLPCPVVASDLYATGLSCPVFLSPCPHHIPLERHLRPWEGREIWLDLAADMQTITLTAAGSEIQPLAAPLPPEGFRDESLACHYRMDIDGDSVRFTLWRTSEDLEALAHKADSLGIHAVVGLFREMKKPVCKIADRF